MSAAPSVAASSSSAKPAFAKSRWRWFQFSLRTLFIAMLLLSILLGGFAWRLKRAKRQAEAIATLREHSCEVRYDYELAAQEQDLKRP